MYFVGIVLAEVFTYFRSFWGKDRWPLLAFVGFLTGCQLVYTALTVCVLVSNLEVLRRSCTADMHALSRQIRSPRTSSFLSQRARAQPRNLTSFLAAQRWTVVQWGQFAELANISPEVLWANPMISFITLGVQSFCAPHT